MDTGISARARHDRLRRSHLALLALLLTSIGCSSAHRGSRVGDDGSVPFRIDGSATDGGRAQDGGGCPPIGCAPECDIGIGPDGCGACDCPPMGRECADDSDCGLARNTLQCCDGCLGAYPTDRFAVNGCLARPGHPQPPRACQDARPVCDSICPSDPCAGGVRATCSTAGVCTTEGCGPEEVPFQGECAPRCGSHADCIVATPVIGCCGGCETAYHRDYAAARPCIPSGDPVPADCTPPPEDCMGIGCTGAECPAGHAACMDTGDCRHVEMEDICPFGYADFDGVCVPVT